MLAKDGPKAARKAIAASDIGDIAYDEWKDDPINRVKEPTDFNMESKKGQRNMAELDAWARGEYKRIGKHLRELIKPEFFDTLADFDRDANMYAVRTAQTIGFAIRRECQSDDVCAEDMEKSLFTPLPLWAYAEAQRSEERRASA